MFGQIVVKDPEKQMAENCLDIEMMTHQKIDGEYPESKYQAVIELLNYKARKNKLSTTTLGGMKHG